ncbi:hypothetical protein SPI_03734 [Niveomyces insectorum RCEF 264]|uniref:DUF4246 domain-containing protein n=1 Tax=Niveomyces insectorum RCEF 264 TaxID=1081102 RepID=A0A167WBA3_9HYPO|nr:hypothetical protein SPI_03734 [Niveomyces insectorum RCEF 264]
MPGLIDPNWLPLIYGQTRVLGQGGRVGLLSAAEAMGRGTAADLQSWERSALEIRPGSRPGTMTKAQMHLRKRRAYRFSPCFQWLPCEVALGQDRDKTKKQHDAPQVTITSYINNLHPRWYRTLYQTIEQCIAASIQPWNEVLLFRNKGKDPKRFQGRDPPRIRTFGVQWTPEFPKWAADLETVSTDKESKAYHDAYAKVCDYIQQPDDLQAPPAWPGEPHIGADWETSLGLLRAVSLKYDRIKHWLHPEPGTAFTFDEWKAGKTGAAIVPPRLLGGKRPVTLHDHQFYTVSLGDMFQEQGLQVVVEMGSVELLPGEPACGETDWQLAGTLNEHIVATSVIYFSSVNMTPESAALSFRVEADLDPLLHTFGPASGSMPYHPFEPLAAIYGLGTIWRLGDNVYHGPGGTGPAVQALGTVLTPDGRLVTFPNAVQHKIGACNPLDTSLPGRRRFLKMHLVDPHYRIASTRNVPPQQRDWWAAAAALDRIDWAAHSIPPEVVDMIEQETGQDPWPLSPAEAARLWKQAKDEQRAVQDDTFSKMCHYMFGSWASEGFGWPFDLFPHEYRSV